MAINRPAFLWGTPLTTWTNFSGVSHASATDPFGGASATRVTGGSNAAGSVGGGNVALTASAYGYAMLAFFVKAGTSTSTGHGLLDTVAGTFRYRVTLSWAAGVPTVAATLAGVTLEAPRAVGGGWYLVRGYTTAALGGVVHRVNHFPDLNGGTATVDVYQRSVAVLDLCDDPLYWESPRDGYDAVQARSGAEDAWMVGTDYLAALTARWIPQFDTAYSIGVSGWEGGNEIPGVNCGIAAMLRAGRDKQDIRVAPDLGTVAQSVVARLVEPLQDGVDLEPNGTRRVRLVFRQQESSWGLYW